MLDDSELVRRASDGDDQAFNAIYERHVGAIRGYVVGRIGPDAADDVVSEVFLVAWRAAERFDPSATSARPWLYGIATNVMAKHRELEARWIAQHRAESQATGRSTGELTAYHLDPELVRAIGTLSPSHRDVLLLTALGELPVADVARALGIRQSTARVRLLRARRHVRGVLGGDHDD